MSAPKFTPGPWVAHQSTRYRGPIGYAWDIATGAAEWDPRDYDRDEGTRGTWNYPDGYTRIATTSDTSGDCDAAANAALIAAAPELYAALELAVATIERLAQRHGPFSSADGTLVVARSALGKAVVK